MELPSGVHRIRLPMANSMMGSVNAWLIEGGEECALVDCGWDTPESMAALQEALRGAGVRLERIRTLVATHYHWDHYGQSRALVEQQDLRLMMHRVDWETVRDEMFDNHLLKRRTEGWLRQNGFSFENMTQEQVRTVIGLQRALAPTQPHVLLQEGDEVRVGSHTLRVVETPGHTQGHICLHDPERKWLFSGDHILAVITPHVSARPFLGDPLSAFMGSLRKVAAMDVDWVFPGHGKPFQGLGRRAAELLAVHATREGEVLESLSRGPATAVAVASRLAWDRGSRSFSQLHLSLQRAALGRTLAYLERLRVQGRVSIGQNNGHVYYELASAGAASGEVSARVWPCY